MHQYDIKEIREELIGQGYGVEKVVVSHLGTSKNSLFVYINKEKHVLKLYNSKKKRESNGSSTSFIKSTAERELPSS